MVKAIVVTPPEPVVSLADAKKHLRVDHTDDDVYIEALVAGATGWLDGPDGWLGRALGRQLIELQIGGFGCWHERFSLPYPPLLSVESVTYLDELDALQTISPADYVVRNGDIWTRPTYTAPNLSVQPDPVFVRYWAGYASPSEEDAEVWVNDIPKPIWVAILMLVSQYYENRSPILQGESMAQLPFAVEALLSTFRKF